MGHHWDLEEAPFAEGAAEDMTPELTRHVSGASSGEQNADTAEQSHYQTAEEQCGPNTGRYHLAEPRDEASALGISVHMRFQPF